MQLFYGVPPPSMSPFSAEGEFRDNPASPAIKVFGVSKINPNWREGPPVTGLCQSVRSAGRAFTLR
jgi:hypothetical protein